jgi:hypothetical protein
MIKVFQEILMHIDQGNRNGIYKLFHINLYKIDAISNLEMNQIHDDNHQEILQFEFQHFHY